MFSSANLITVVFTVLVSLNFFLAQQLEKQQITSYQTCKYDSDCKEAAFCYGNDDTLNGTCKCKDGYDIFRNKTDYECFKAAQYDEPCEFDYYCTEKLGNFGICNEGTKLCSCNDSVSHVYQPEGFCYETKKINDVCLSDKQCRLANREFRYCSEGHCACKLDERPTPDLRNCQVNKLVGEQCATDEECQVIPNSICGNTCQCAVGYVISRNSSNCLQAATKFGQPCEENDQCTNLLKHSTCNGGKCSCPENYHQIDYLQCLRDTGSGQKCTQTEDCINSPDLKDNVECVSGICTCSHGLDEKGQCKSSSNSLNLLNNKLFTTIIVILLFLLIK